MSSSLAKSLLRRFAIALVAVFALSSWGVAYGYWFVHTKYDDIVHKQKMHTDPLVTGDPINFLIIGSDSRSFVKTKLQAEQFGSTATNGGQRSDTIMVAHVDPKTKTTLLVSLPRDLWVEIPGHGHQKLNAAFNNGPQSVIDTLKLNFGIPIHHYLEVDFRGFEGIVNAIGAVDVYFPTIARDTYTGLFIATPGCHALNGKQALQYNRSRSYEYKTSPQANWRKDPRADLGRIARQQYFIRSLAATAISKGFSNIGTATDLIDKSLRSLTVDAGLRFEDLVRLADAFRTTKPGELQMETVPVSPATINGQAALVLKRAEAAPLLARLLPSSGGNDPINAIAAATKVKPETVTVSVLNGSGTQGIAKQALADLHSKGFNGSSTGNATRPDFPTTIVRYSNDAGGKDRALTVLAYLGGVGHIELDEAITTQRVVVILGQDFVAVAAPGSIVKKPSTSSSSTGASGSTASGTPAVLGHAQGFRAINPGATAVGCPKS